MHGQMLCQFDRCADGLASEDVVVILPQLLLSLQARADEIAEERVRTSWTALEFRVELRRDEPGMIDQLDDFNQFIVSRMTAYLDAVRFHAFTVFIIELVAVAMALEDD